MSPMTEMENAIMAYTGCNRSSANLAANAVLDIDQKCLKESKKKAKEKASAGNCNSIGGAMVRAMIEAAERKR